MRKKLKLQVTKDMQNPKWIPPELRMKHYERDYGIDHKTLMDDPKWKKVKDIDFRIVVMDEETKKQLQSACEYLHDNRLIDTDFLAVNSLVHAYENSTNTNGHQFDPIVVNPNLFKKAKQQTRIHKEHYFYDNIEFCKHCHKCLS